MTRRIYGALSPLSGEVYWWGSELARERALGASKVKRTERAIVSPSALQWLDRLIERGRISDALQGATHIWLGR